MSQPDRRREIKWQLSLVEGEGESLSSHPPQNLHVPHSFLEAPTQTTSYSNDVFHILTILLLTKMILLSGTIHFHYVQKKKRKTINVSAEMVSQLVDQQKNEQQLITDGSFKRFSLTDLLWEMRFLSVSYMFRFIPLSCLYSKYAAGVSSWLA